MTPTITLRESPAPNDWGYTGPASLNPFFHRTGIAPNYDFVPNFYGWFQAVAVYNTTTGNVDHYIEPRACASPEGAQEALRLVQMFEPGATLEFVRVEEGGIYYADRLTPLIVLPGACRLNAGSVLNRYYHGGAGVSAESDLALMAELGVERPADPPPVDPPPAEPNDKDHAVTPGAEGPLAAPAGLSPAQRDLGPGSEEFPVGSIYVSLITGKHWLREPTYWRMVQQ